MSLARKLAVNTGVQIAGKMLSTATGVVIIGLLTRRLGLEEFGVYSTANAFLQVFALLLDLGLNVTFTALLGEHADDPAFEKRCVSALFTLRILMCVVVLGALAPMAALLTSYPAPLKWTILLLTASFAFPALNQVVIGVQQRHLRMSMAAVAENVGRFVVLGALLCADRFGLGLLGLSAMISVAAAANFFLNFWSARSFSGLRWSWDPEFWRLALLRSWPVGLSIALNVVYYKADTLILSRVRPLAEVGVYSAAYRVLEILITVPFIYAGLLLPILATHWAKKDLPRLQTLLRYSMDAMVIGVVPMVLGTWLLGRQIMTLVAGAEFAPAGSVIKILILAVAAIYLNTILSHAIVAIGKQKRMLPFYGLVALMTLIGYLVFIPRFGMWAAAWLTVFSETAILASSFFVTRREIPVAITPKTGLAVLLAGAGMMLVAWPVRSVWIGIPIVLSGLTYLGLLFLFGGLRPELWEEIKKR